MKNKVLLMLLYGLIMGIIGFVIGRCTVEPETTVKTMYKHLPTVHDTIPNPVPYKVEVPSDPEYIYLDTNKTVIDTSAIIKDWMSKKSYKEILFDNDSIGKLKLDVEVQGNELRKLDYEFNPVQVTTTTITSNKKKLEFLGGVGLSTNGMFNIQVGIFTKSHLGFSYQFNRDFNDNENYHGLNILLKF